MQSHPRSLDRYAIIFLVSLVAVFMVIAFVDGATNIGLNIHTENITASSSVLIKSGLTTYGTSTFGDATSDINLFTGRLHASTTALFTSGFTTYGNWTVGNTSTTTVTFSSTGINFDSNTLVLDPNANRVGIGLASPKTRLEVNGTASTTKLLVGEGLVVNGLVFGNCTFNSGAITASTSKSVNCTGADGVRSGDRVFVTPVSLPRKVYLLSASSTSSNVIQVTVDNTTGAAVTPASSSWDWMGIR